MLTRPPDRTKLPEPTGHAPGPVVVVPVVSDDPGVLLAGLDATVAGVVLAAFGAGHVPEAMVAQLEALAHRVPVVLASRTFGGPVLERTYGTPDPSPT